MDKLTLLRGEDFQFNSFIHIHYPTLGEIASIGEEIYYDAIYKFCSTPSDHKVMLDDMGIDYSQIDDWELFMMLYRQLFSDNEKKALSLIFNNFDITIFDVATRLEFNDVVLALDEDTIFDRAVYLQITSILREMNSLVRRVDRPGNEHTRKYLIDKERRKLQRRRNKKQDSYLYPLVVALINTPEFKYDYKTVWELTVYQFNQSVKHIQKVKEFGFVMQGIYAGTVDSSKLDMSKIHWLQNS